jgi:UDP-2,3-diacylglucosamine pyrophosphatase LpxH
MRAFISDLHLGNVFIKEALLKTLLGELRKVERLELVLVGDVFDLWRKPDLKELMTLFKDLQVLYIVGNHDKQLELGTLFGAKIYNSLSVLTKTSIVTAVHGDEFDKEAAYPGVLARCMDSMVYALSEAVGVNFRELVKPIADFTYWMSGLNDRVFCDYGVANDAIVMGHTHVPGHTVVAKDSAYPFHIFNLGSWLHQPWIFFLEEDGRYAFYPVEKTHLLPTSEDFKSLR